MKTEEVEQKGAKETKVVVAAKHREVSIEIGNHILSAIRDGTKDTLPEQVATVLARAFPVNRRSSNPPICDGVCYSRISGVLNLDDNASGWEVTVMRGGIPYVDGIKCSAEIRMYLRIPTPEELQA